MFETLTKSQKNRGKSKWNNISCVSSNNSSTTNSCWNNNSINNGR